MFLQDFAKKKKNVRAIHADAAALFGLERKKAAPPPAIRRYGKVAF